VLGRLDPVAFVIQATRPTDILLLRHAEEPADESDPDLQDAGQLRAERLAAFIPAMLGKPDLIIAAAANRRSVRAFLTVRPLSRASGVRICSRFRAHQSEALAAMLITDDAFAQKTIVICWTHKELPQLAKMLKARRQDYPDPWDESVFDVILHLRYRGRAKPVVKKVVQPL